MLSSVQLDTPAKPGHDHEHSPNRKDYRQEKKTQGSEKKYHAHGDSTNMITHVESITHGSISARVSDDFHGYPNDLTAINRQVDATLRERYDSISLIETKAIGVVVEEQKKIIQQLFEKGRDKANEYEEDQQRLIEEFVQKAKVKMIDRLDLLNKEVKRQELLVIETVEQCIKEITQKAQNARQEVHHRLQDSARAKIDQHLGEIYELHRTGEQNLFGFERYKTVNFRFYASAGNLVETIDDAADLVDDLKKVEPRPPIKRTVYVGLDGHQTL